ncbi:hypothetical protein BU16DRAFT_555427 [Lophium mytilinum]|uniref:F-box domain-containing protein n=1 Tax=Lophium mytilinum TaxID=390894 RepID=A0A6A6R7Z0_9PEZI|nr:hypothetical protein BU16DRAFT_555427 [Lophium mytilinum]
MNAGVEKMVPTGILDCPSELVDQIVQLLPQTSFLALRATCKDLQRKTDYHFKKRHLPEKTVTLANDFRPSLASLMGFASYPHFARLIRKVCVEVEIDTLLQGNWLFSMPKTPTAGKWTNHFNTSPEMPRTDDRVVDIGLLFTSLGKLPALEVLEFAQYNDLSTPAAHLGDQQLVDTDWCEKCRKPSRYDQCVHFTMFCDALLAIARSCVDLVNLCKHYNISSDKTAGRLREILDLANDLIASDLSAWVEFKRAYPLLPHGVSFKSLREVTFAGNPMVVYHAKDNEHSLLKYILKSSPIMEKITLKGAGRLGTIWGFNQLQYHVGWGMQPLCMHWGPRRELLNTRCLTSVTLSCLHVHAHTINYFLQEHGQTLRQLMLEGLALPQPFRVVLASYEKATKLELLYVRAPFTLPPGLSMYFAPTVFGDLASRQEVQVFLYGGSIDQEEMKEIWQKTVPPGVLDTSTNRDMIGWRFEGEAVQPGVRFLMANERRLYGL